MSVHYKFKTSLEFDTITFDGLHISVADLKKAILHQKRIGKTTDFDLQITNAQTKEEFPDDSSLIPKNTSLIIARIPLAIQPKKPWDPTADKQQIRPQVEQDRSHVDLSRMNGSEEDKIHAMMMQSTIDYDPHNYQKIRGASQTGEVPQNYRCFKCHKPGHWIKNCPLGPSINKKKRIYQESIDMKRNTGIPRSFIDRDQSQDVTTQSQPPPPIEKKQEIPDDLICSICKDLFTDAVMIPCCGSSFCDECVRTALLESEDNECPDCKEKGSSPGSLIPNRFLRNSVNAFRNETGYNKPRQPLPQTKMQEMIKPDKDDVTNDDDDDDTKHEMDENSTQSISDFKEIDGLKEGDDEYEEDVVDEDNEDDEDDEDVPRSLLTETPPPKILIEIENELNKDDTNNVKSPIIDENSKDVGGEDVKEQNNTEGEISGVGGIIAGNPTESPQLSTGDHKGTDNESDFEDNITITMPPAHLQSRGTFRDRQLNGRHGRVPKPPGLDTPPKHHPQYHGMNHEERSGTPTVDEHETNYNAIPTSTAQQPTNSGDHIRGMSYPTGVQPRGHMTGGTGSHSQMVQHAQQIMRPDISGGPIQHTGHEGYGMPHPSQMGYPQPMPGGRPQLQGGYDSEYRMHPAGPYPPQHRPYDPRGVMAPHHYHQDKIRGPYPGPPRGGYHPQQQHMMRGGPRHMGGVGNPSLQMVYQGVAAKVGTGIIDDPLEAFNRIMQERERRKEESRRNASPHEDRHGRRSRSNDMGDRRRSPNDRRRSPRQRSPDERRLRSPDDRGARGRSHDRRSEDRRRRRSSSYSRSSRSSRTYSRSRSRSRKRSRTPRKRSRSLMRRSRSRSQSFNMGRYGGGNGGGNMNNRYKDGGDRDIGRGSRRGHDREHRRDDFREDYRNTSPNGGYGNGQQQHYGGMRGRGGYMSGYRGGRGRGGHMSHYNRSDRQQQQQQMNMMHNQDHGMNYYPGQSNYDNQQPPMLPGNGSGTGGSNQINPIGGNNGGAIPSNLSAINPTQQTTATQSSTNPSNNNSRYQGRHQSGNKAAVPSPKFDEEGNLIYRGYDDVPVGALEPPPPGFESAATPTCGFNDIPEEYSNSSYPASLREDFRRHRDDYRGEEYHNIPGGHRISRESDRPIGVVVDGNEHNRRSRSRTSQQPNNYGDRRRRSRSRSNKEGRKDRDTGKEQTANNEKDQRKDSSSHRRDHESSKKTSNRDHGKDSDRAHDRTRSGKDDKDKEKDKDKDKDKEKEKEKDKDRDKQKRLAAIVAAAESSEEEKRDKKSSKEKKKRKKEKEAEKKRSKKERKEKREKEREKKSDKEAAAAVAKALVEKIVSEKLSTRKMEETVIDTIISSEQKMIVPPDELIVAAALLNVASSDREDENDDEDEPTNGITFDLYSDVLEDDKDIKLNDVVTGSNDTNKLSVSPMPMLTQEQQQPSTQPQPATIKRSDSILDIHANMDFEQDLDMEMDSEATAAVSKRANSALAGNVFVPLPEPSKWERDDEIVSSSSHVSSSGVVGSVNGNSNVLSASSTSDRRTPNSELSNSMNSNLLDDKSNKVTNEVLKRAENAIFARAINAIRPIEIKKISVERQKLYANEKPHGREHGSPPITSLIIRSDDVPSAINLSATTVSTVTVMPALLTPSLSLGDAVAAAAAASQAHNFQITVPTNGDSTERSVEIKTDIKPESKRSARSGGSPLRSSIKERLGSKITSDGGSQQLVTSSRKSRSRSPPPPPLVAVNNATRKRTESGSRGGRSRSRGENRNRSPEIGNMNVNRRRESSRGPPMQRGGGGNFDRRGGGSNFSGNRGGNDMRRPLDRRDLRDRERRDQQNNKNRDRSDRRNRDQKDMLKHNYDNKGRGNERDQWGNDRNRRSRSRHNQQMQMTTTSRNKSKDRNLKDLPGKEMRGKSRDRKKERSRSNSGNDKRRGKDKKHKKEKDKEKEKELRDKDDKKKKSNDVNEKNNSSSNNSTNNKSSSIVSSKTDQDKHNLTRDLINKKLMPTINDNETSLLGISSHEIAKKIQLIERKRSTIDEANFIPDYDEQMDLDVSGNTHGLMTNFMMSNSSGDRPGIDKMLLETEEGPKLPPGGPGNVPGTLDVLSGSNSLVNVVQMKRLIPSSAESSSVNKKRSHSSSSSSSSSSDSSSSDSSSDSDDNRNSKRRGTKRKHKKQTKKTIKHHHHRQAGSGGGSTGPGGNGTQQQSNQQQPSSSESESSSQAINKRKKNKKKSKAGKKKKKSKHK